MVLNVHGGEIAQKELDEYVRRAEKQYGTALEGMDVEVDGDFVNIHYTLHPNRFDRIRRITGYLVGTTDRFNDAKQAEERDRVKHTL